MATSLPPLAEPRAHGGASGRATRGREGGHIQIHTHFPQCVEGGRSSQLWKWPPTVKTFIQTPLLIP